MGPFGPPGAAWVVHKFGGTCVGDVRANFQRREHPHQGSPDPQPPSQYQSQ